MVKKDEFGPEYVIKVYDPSTRMEGFLVIDNTAIGVGKGGIRMTADVTEEEVGRLARTMTWKNALAGIPFGGAKAGMVWQGGTNEEKKKHVQAFARALKPFLVKKYIAGPDVNSGEKEMQWFVEAVGEWRAATGKPANYCMKIFGKEGEKCGIPHEFGSTGFGVAHATKVAAELAGIELKGATVSIHGFGNVGTFAFKYLTEMGAKVIAIADKSGAVHDPNGFDFDTTNGLIEHRKSVTEYKKGRKIVAQDFWKIPVDILIPASVTDVINDSNKNDIQAKSIVEAANIPMTEQVEAELWKRGALIVPDFVANAGGVISSYAEHRGYNPKRMFELVERKITAATATVLKESMKAKRNPREVALEIAKEKVTKAMKLRGQTP